MQVHARVYDENKLEEKMIPIEIILWLRIKMSSSELQGQEEAACAHVFRPK